MCRFPRASCPGFNWQNSFREQSPVETVFSNIGYEVRLFDDAGKPLGGTWSRTYRWQPYVVSIKGTVAPGDNRFGKSVTIELLDAASGGTVRYAVGQPVTAASPLLDRPIVVEKSGGGRDRLFRQPRQAAGLAWKQNFRKVDFDPTNITYKKPVILWGSSTKQAAEVAVDGVVDHEQFLDIQPAPQQFGIDLEGVKTLGKVVLYTYWDGGRFYQYKIDVSTDGKQWTNVADASKNREKATEHGYAHSFPPAQGPLPSRDHAPQQRQPRLAHCRTPCL